jgi:type IV secretory pathway VirB2 component (pilin)
VSQPALASSRDEPHEQPARRIRQEVRGGVAVFCASASVSVAVALMITLLMKLAG